MIAKGSNQGRLNELKTKAETTCNPLQVLISKIKKILFFRADDMTRFWQDNNGMVIHDHTSTLVEMCPHIL